MRLRLLLRACTLTVFAIAATSHLSAAEWERLAPLPEPNGGFICGSVAGRLIIAGGTNWRDGTKHWLDAVWTYDPQQNQWRTAGRLSTPLAYAAIGQDARDLWFWSGSTGKETQRALSRFDEKFSAKTVATLDRGLVYTGNAVSNGSLYVVGGSDDQSKFENVTNTFLAIDLQSGKSRRLADYPEVAVGTATAAACGGRIFVFGGARWEASTKSVVNFATAHAYSIAENGWKALPPLPAPIRGLTAITLNERYIYLAGGYTTDEAGFTADAHLLDVERGEYLPAKKLPYGAMVGLVILGDDLYCLGGEDVQKHRTDAVYRIAWKELLPAAK